MVWHSHLLKNFPEFVVVHRVKAFGLVNKAEVDAFMELFSFFNDPMDVGNIELNYIKIFSFVIFYPAFSCIWRGVGL